mmetsp:Transcript_56710/g.137901  ORF Transcript_56710/g.137901 Transcript_56710/m.137901 type:complete len:186 (-) Transcript_56710:2683-3240(-)
MGTSFVVPCDSVSYFFDLLILNIIPHTFMSPSLFVGFLGFESNLQKFWPIIHCITYSLIPAQHRILWVNCVDLVWNGLLASMAQKKSSVFEELDNEDENEENLKALSAFEVSSVVIDDIDHSHDSEDALSSNLAAATTTNVDQSTDQLEINKEEKSLKIVNDTMSIDFEEVSNTTATSSIKTANV